MNNEKFYFVDDIENGVLISTSTKDSPGKKIFPEMPTLTFICHNSSDAVDIAKLIIDRQDGIPYQDGDTVIEVSQVFYSSERFDEKYEFKVV